MELDSQQCVSVDVKISDDIRDRKQPPPTSPVKATHGQEINRTMLPPRPHITTTPTRATTVERRRHDGPRRALTPTSIIHLTVGPIHFGHSQPGLQKLSQPVGGRATKCWKTPVERSPTKRTTSRTPGETETGQNMLQTEKKRFPQAQASRGAPLTITKEQQLTPEPASYPETKVKRGKQRDLTSIRDADEDYVNKDVEESVSKPRYVPEGKRSQEGLSSVQNVAPDTGEILPVRKKSISDKIPVSTAPTIERPLKSPVSSQETELQKETQGEKPAKTDPKSKLSIDKRKLPAGVIKKERKSVGKSGPTPARKSSLESLPSVHEISVLSLDTEKLLPARKKSILQKKPVRTESFKQSLMKPRVSAQETHQQENEETKPAQKSDVESDMSSLDKCLSTDVKNSGAEKKKQATLSEKRRSLKYPASPEETLPQKAKPAKPVDKTLRKSELSSPDSGKLPLKKKKSVADKKRATRALAKDSLKGVSRSPEEEQAKATAPQWLVSKAAESSDDIKEVSKTTEKSLPAASLPKRTDEAPSKTGDPSQTSEKAALSSQQEKPEDGSKKQSRAMNGRSR
ncbi:hypothetical protein MRX96_021847 [Rhipicephalus microplus]